NKVVYLAARDVAESNSGWQPMGVWQVPAGAMTTTAVLRMAPAGATAFGPVHYACSFFDSKGVQDLGVENILVDSALHGRRAFCLAYASTVMAFYLVNDAGDGLSPGESLTAGGTRSNGQCPVSWRPSAVAANVKDLTLTLTIVFSPTFTGNRVFYLAD